MKKNPRRSKKSSSSLESPGYEDMMRELHRGWLREMVDTFGLSIKQYRTAVHRLSRGNWRESNRKYHPYSLGDHARRLLSDSLTDAARYVSVNFALEALMELGPDSIYNRRRAVHFLKDLEEPLCSRETLCDMISSFASALESERSSMISSGIIGSFPPETIWLARRLGLNIPAPEDYDINMIEHYPLGVQPEWAEPTWQTERRIAGEQGRSEPPPDWNLEEILLLRERLWKLKLEVLRATVDPLRKRDADLLSDRYVRLLATELSHTESVRVSELARLYPYPRQIKSTIGDLDPVDCPLIGGMDDLLYVMRFFFKEVRSGLICTTGESLGEFAGKSETGEHRLLFADYWEMIGRPKRESADHALDNLMSMVNEQNGHEEAFGDLIQVVAQKSSRRVIERTLKASKPSSGLASSSQFPLPAGTKWEDITIEFVSLDSAIVRVPGYYHRYHAIDMGFRDGRRVDLPNKQWDLLWTFAESKGVVRLAGSW